MPPKLLSQDGRNVLIRPLAYVPESELIELRDEIDFPVIPCNLCGSQDNMQRQNMKKMLRELEGKIPGGLDFYAQCPGQYPPVATARPESLGFQGTQS